MSKKDDFVCLVQTAAIVESLSRGEEENKGKASENAACAVSCAMKVNENKLPKTFRRLVRDTLNTYLISL